MNNLISAFFPRRRNILNMLGKRRNNRGMMWASLLGLGVSAAAYGVGRNRNKNTISSFQDLMNNFQSSKASQKPNMATLTEFSKELVPNKNPLTKK